MTTPGDDGTTVNGVVGIESDDPRIAAELSHPVNMCSEAGQYGDFVGQGLGFVGSFFTGAGEEEAAVDAENIIQKCEGGGCFVAGTMVHMADGSWKRIEDVKVGDKVLSRNSETGQDEVETVLHGYVFYKQATLVLKFADGNRIETTAVHPFYVMGAGFVPAGQLKAGDRIVTEKGIAVKLDAARYTGQRKTVYNIEVANDHTYFVGSAHGGVWVHNAGPCDTLTRFGYEYENAEKLAADAAKAEANGFPHGVSAIRNATNPGSVANYDDVASEFNVVKTGRNPNHYTIELPKPVTPDVADSFNGIFGRIP